MVGGGVCAEGCAVSRRVFVGLAYDGEQCAGFAVEKVCHLDLSAGRVEAVRACMDSVENFSAQPAQPGLEVLGCFVAAAKDVFEVLVSGGPGGVEVRDLVAELGCGLGAWAAPPA